MKTPVKVICLLSLAGLCCAALAGDVPARIGRDSIVSSEGITLKDSDRLTTPGVFRPPVEINIVARTDSTNLRLTYAADQVIFNWEGNMDELRVDGGPANGLHKVGAGRIPVNKYVSIRWLVTARGQAVYVNNELRFRHEGDYSGINNGVSIFPGAGSVVTVKSVQVKPLDRGSQ